MEEKWALIAHTYETRKVDSVESSSKLLKMRDDGKFSAVNEDKFNEFIVFSPACFHLRWEFLTRLDSLDFGEDLFLSSWCVSQKLISLYSWRKCFRRRCFIMSSNLGENIYGLSINIYSEKVACGLDVEIFNLKVSLRLREWIILREFNCKMYPRR